MGTDLAIFKRNCPRQRTVREAIDDFDGPFTTVQLWAKCQKHFPGISRATVYREVKKLRDEHYIRDVVLPHGLHLSVRAEAEGCCITECEDCGRFRMSPTFARQVAEAATDTPVIPSHAAIYLRGSCRELNSGRQCPYASAE